MNSIPQENRNDQLNPSVEKIAALPRRQLWQMGGVVLATAVAVAAGIFAFPDEAETAWDIIVDSVGNVMDLNFPSAE